jgi:hypothetical protein
MSASASAPASASSASLAAVKRTFLKGQLHAHTWNSADGSAPPEAVVRWYGRHDFDFVVITDHNRITAAASTLSLLVLQGVELTINLRTCEPPPRQNESCLLHMNALLPERSLAFEPWIPRTRSIRRADIYGEELEEAKRLGAIAQLNHPNFHFAADASTIAGLAERGLALMEIANEAQDSMNEGDARHPSTEALWDAALSKGARLFGTATDDAHDYFGDEREAARWPMAYTGDRGFVMVRAERSARSIREALLRGDFYASTGLLFERVDLAKEGAVIEVAGGEVVSFEAIGEGGRALLAEQGQSLRFEPRALGSAYVRVRATDREGRRAWTQPVFLDKR